MDFEQFCKCPCPTKKLVILDTDLAIDRAVCLDYLLAAKDIEVLAVTLVAGEYDMETIKDTACRIASFLDADKTPIFAGGKYNISGERVYTDSVYGDYGFGNIELPKGNHQICNQMSAPNAMIYFGKKYPGQVHLLCTGPLTNIALAYLIDNDFPSYFRSISLFGMDYCHKTFKGATPFAEFNAIRDPWAIDIVSRCFTNMKDPINIVDWSIVLKNLLPFGMIERITERSCECGDNKFIDLFEILTNPTNPVVKRQFWETGYLAGALMLPVGLEDSEIFWTTKRVSVDVIKCGECIGHTRMEEKPHGNFNLVTGIDRDKAVQNIIKVFKSSI